MEGQGDQNKCRNKKYSRFILLSCRRLVVKILFSYIKILNLATVVFLFYLVINV